MLVGKVRNDDYKLLNISDAEGNDGDTENIAAHTWNGHLFGHKTRRLID